MERISVSYGFGKPQTEEEWRDALEVEYICRTCDSKGIFIDEHNYGWRCRCSFGNARAEIKIPKNPDLKIPLLTVNPYWERKRKKKEN